MANNNKRAFYVNGEMLRKIISIRGLTQADVYKAIGIGENTIYRVIKHNRMENENDFDKMCQYLDINPALLFLKSFVYRSEESDQEYIITTDNLEMFIEHLGYTNDFDKRFDKDYIHEFFKGAPHTEYLNGEFEGFLFDKILESRDYFTTMFFLYHLSHKDEKSNSHDESFCEAFNSWFEKNIASQHNKKLK